MSNISSPSARGTRKTAPKLDTNGTQPTDPNSEPISPDSDQPPPTDPNETTWYAEEKGGRVLKVRVKGANGRISYGRAQHGESGEVRFYRTPTAKHYDAVLPGISKVWSQNVLVESLGKTSELIEMEEAMAKEQKDAYERAISMVVKKAVPSPFDEDEDAPWPSSIPALSSPLLKGWSKPRRVPLKKLKLPEEEI